MVEGMIYNLPDFFISTWKTFIEQNPVHINKEKKMLFLFLISFLVFLNNNEDKLS